MSEHKEFFNSAVRESARNLEKDSRKILTVEIQVLRSEWEKIPKTALFLPIYEDKNRFDPFVRTLDLLIGKQLSRLANSKENSGKGWESSVLRPEESSLSPLLVIGAGKKEDFNLDKFRSLCALAARLTKQLGVKSLAVPIGNFFSFKADVSAQIAVEGAVLGLYRFSKYKAKQPDEQKKEGLPEQLLLLVKKQEEIKKAEEGARGGKILADAANFTRDLVNEPSNVMTPTAFSDHARALAQELNLKITILAEEEIRNLGMQAFLSVAKGSREPPQLIVMRYKGGGPFTLGLVGKGVTFDSGGISIKPSENMHYMTNDMAGAAACLGALKAIAQLKIPINVIAVLPMAENLPDGKAYKPGDIIRSYSGKTIEIINTDAEGRMLLADALAYIATLKVNAIVDLATLTGGVGIALGSEACGLFSNHKALVQEVRKAGREAHEPGWALPLFEGYSTQVKGNFADLKNSAGRKASPCTAAAFLKEFVGDTPWAHLDIASTAFVENEKIPYLLRPYLPENGATGAGVRTLVYLAGQLSRKKGL